MSGELRQGQTPQCVSLFFFFSSRRRHTRCLSDWSSDVCSSDLVYAVWSRDQRIDFGKRRPDGVDGRIELLHDVGGRTDLLDVAVQREAERQGLMREEPVARIDRQLMDFVGCLGGHFLDVDAARGTHHEDGPLRRAIHDDADVALRRDLRRRRDEHLVHREVLDRHAEDGFGMRLGLGSGFGEFHTAGLTAAAGMDLGLHHDLAAEALRDGAGFRRRAGDLTRRDRDAVAPQNVPCLILVQIHACSFAIVVPALPCNAASPSASSAMMARSPPARTKSAAASTLGRMLPVPSSFPASRWSACANVSLRIACCCGVPYARYTAFTFVRINRTSAWISRPRMAATRSLSATASIPSRPSLGSRYTGGPPPPPAMTMYPATQRSCTIWLSTMPTRRRLGASRRPSRNRIPRAARRAARGRSSVCATGFEGVRRSGSSARHNVWVIRVTTERRTPARSNAFWSDC